MTKANIAQWDTTAANNTDINDISLAENVMKPPAVNNAMREQMAQTAQWTGEGTIASASTMDIGAEAEEFLNVTGTTTVTALGTVRAGTKRRLLFAGALTLTHNATSLILPGAADITTAAGDIAVFVSEGSGNWRCVSYQVAASRTATQAQLAALPFQKYFESAQQTITSGAAVILEHGFGESPKLVRCTLICITPEYGYTAGKELDFSHVAITDSVASSRGVTPWWDDVDIRVRYGAATNAIYAHRADSSTAVSLTNANWRMIVRAWA